MLADINVQGHLEYLRNLIDALALTEILIGLRLATFPELGLDRDTGDRAVWEFCQREQWVLFTDDRSAIGEDSLQRTLDDSWRPGLLPVITIGNKPRFENDRTYADGVAEDVATLLFDIKQQGFHRDRPRIYLPFARA